jgi:mono/diheme cytochrome c family protein
MMEGKGGKVGPDLSQEAKLGRSSQWVIAQIVDPIKHNPMTKMPAHPNLIPAQLKGLADYILKPSSSPAAPGAGTAANAAPDQGNASPDSTSTDTNATATVVKMIGDPKHGAVLFDLDCAKCHGKDGEGQMPNPGSQAGVAPALAPITHALFNADPVVFAANIDRIIQHGAPSVGPSPALTMPAFGETHSLTLPETANIEAYVLSLNGVDAAKIIQPGITPSHFVEGTVALFALALLVVGGLWVHCRTEGSTLSWGRPTPEEFQTLQHEVADLKHKLEERDTRSPKDSSGGSDSQP